MSGDLTGRNMTSPPRSCLVRLGWVRSRYLIGLILVLTWPIHLSQIWSWHGWVMSGDLTGQKMTSPPRLCLVRLGRVRSRYLIGLTLVLSWPIHLDRIVRVVRRAVMVWYEGVAEVVQTGVGVRVTTTERQLWCECNTRGGRLKCSSTNRIN